MGYAGKEVAAHGFVLLQLRRHVVEGLGQDAHFVHPFYRYGLPEFPFLYGTHGLSQGEKGTDELLHDDVADADADDRHAQADPQEGAMDGLDVLQLRCAAHHVMPHAHAPAGSHLQVLGEMRIHLAVYQKEDDGNRHGQQDEDHRRQAEY